METFGQAVSAISIHALLAESDAIDVFLAVWAVISIHALLAESDFRLLFMRFSPILFLSTLSLRRATPRSRDNSMGRHISIHALLAESDNINSSVNTADQISIHALLAESDFANFEGFYWWVISIHALLAESDARNTSIAGRITSFLSTLSLRRATAERFGNALKHLHFYPRSPCGERLLLRVLPFFAVGHFYPRSPCGERRTFIDCNSNFTQKFLSTLSLRRAT